MDSHSEIRVAIADSPKKLVLNNLRQACLNMEQMVKSGKTADQFGSHYNEASLRDLKGEMDFDIQELVPGSFVVRPERLTAIIDWVRKLKKSKNTFGELLTEPYTERTLLGSYEELLKLLRLSGEMSSEEPQHLKNFVSAVLNRIYDHPIPSISAKNRLRAQIDYETKQGEDLFDNSFSFQIVPNENIVGKKVKAVVTTTHPELPVAQEEYLHAAQELSLGTVEGREYLDPVIFKASKQVTHSSIVLDRILSAAAAELGPEEFTYWAHRADAVTDEFRTKVIKDIFAPWNKTPLGKDVNKRFRYPLVDDKEIGALLVDRSEDFEKFLFYKEGVINPHAQSLFEILSLQYGVNHRELTYQMYDLVESPIHTDEDIERMGRQAIEWGKKLLTFYKGKSIERELVTHHSHIEEPIDESQFEYEATRSIIHEINSSINDLYPIPTTMITLDKLADIAKVNVSKKITNLLQAIFPVDPDVDVPPSQEILDQYDLTYPQYMQIISTARGSYRRYLQTKSSMRPWHTIASLMKKDMIERFKKNPDIFINGFEKD